MGTHTITGAELKQRGQRRSLDAATEEHFRALVAAVHALEPGAEFTVNDLRDALDAAGVPRVSRGGLFGRAIAEGHAAPLEFHARGRIWRAFDASTGQSAHAAQVRVYVRPRVVTLDGTAVTP